MAVTFATVGSPASLPSRHLEGGGCARETEVIAPLVLRIGQVGVDVGAVKNVARAVGVEDLAPGDLQCRKRAAAAALVVPEQAALAEGDAADAAAARREII